MNDTNQSLILGRLEEELKKLIRRVDTLQKSVDLMYADRNILEDILAKQRVFDETLKLHREHLTLDKRDLKADIRDARNSVENKVDDIKDAVEENIPKLVENIEKKSKLLNIKPGFFKRLKKLLRKG